VNPELAGAIVLLVAAVVVIVGAEWLDRYHRRHQRHD